MCADTLGSYGSLARFRSLERIRKVDDFTTIGASGEYSDFQYIMELVEQLMDEQYCNDDGFSFSPNSIYKYLVRVMYQRRSKLNPLWNSLVVCGFRNGKHFLGYTDLYGSNYEDDHVATGFGAHLSKPILRKFMEQKGNDTNNISEEEAREVLERCMRVLYYRDARASDKIQMSIVNNQGVNITKPYQIKSEWTFKGF
jgi:20S proteasome subunit beta 7